ncbi:odorant receptor 23a [Cephus cinctus]|uniref:Odorant receptor n=1 Tax=Cephus cinctus TaxID=211228 RepID=A0AAJ7RL60_CEPCN|nr:odorant receptor 23a [Cephus cinctus]
MANINNCFLCTSFFLRTIASWPGTTRSISNFRKLFNALHVFLVISLITSTILQVSMYIIKNPLDAKVITEILSAQCVYFHVIIKVIMYNVHRKKLIKLLTSVKTSLESNVKPLVNNVETYMKIGIIIYGSYALSIVLLALDYILSPILQSERVLPALMWYPFDYTNSTLFYGLAYAHQITAIQLSGCTLGVEITFGMLVFHCCAQLQYLQYLLQTLILGCHAERSRRTIRVRTAKCIRYQNEILSSINDIDDVHTYIVLVLFCTATVTVSCLGFQLLNIETLSVNSLAKFMLNAGCVLLQLLFYYLPASILTSEAMKVEMAVYRCNWESLLPDQRKDILFILMRSMHVPRLTVGRISSLHLENYMKVMYRINEI